MGELNENKRGSSSGNEKSQTGQENFDENKMGAALSLSISMTEARPSPSFRAVSKLSAKRCLISARGLKRSITASMVCLFLKPNAGT